MDTSTEPSYEGCRFPAEIIAHCVWLYFRFCLSFRDVQEMMLERGVEVSHEGIRLWTLKFGSDYARGLRRGGRGFGDTWHLDEVICRVNGELVYLWRAVDQDGETLDILMQKRRNARAAKRFLRKLLKGLSYVPRAMVTDKLSSYSAAREELLPGVEHRRGGRLNNRAENSHQPTRERERRMALQVDAPCTALFVCARGGVVPFSSVSASTARQTLPGDHASAFCRVESDYGRWIERQDHG
jgi:putative transposase